MLLILQIVLTTVAWGRGWRGWSLLPLGIGITLSLVLALGLGLDPARHQGLYLSLDLTAAGALGLMVWRARRPAAKTSPAPLALEEAAAERV